MGMLPTTAAGGLSSVKSILHAAAPPRLGRARSHPPPEHGPTPSPPEHRPDRVRPSGASASPASAASPPPRRGSRGSAAAASDPPRRETPPATVTRPAAPSPPPAPPPTSEGDGTEIQALAYVSAPERGAQAELHRQEALSDALCRRRGWRLQEVVRDLERQAGDQLRPGLEYALERLARGEASCLIVAELGRLSRSAAELGRIIDWLRRHEIRLLALDIELDTATPVGQMAAEALSSVGAWERGRLPASAAFKGGAVGRAWVTSPRSRGTSPPCARAACPFRGSPTGSTRRASPPSAAARSGAPRPSRRRWATAGRPRGPSTATVAAGARREVRHEQVGRAQTPSVGDSTGT